MLIDPKPVTLTGMDGKDRIYIISKIPAMQSKEIVLQYPTSALPKIGDVALHMQVTQKLLSYAAVPRAEGLLPLELTTQELVNNHIPELRTLMKLERAMAQYNWDFFLPEDLSDFWGRLKNLLVMWSLETSTVSSDQSSLPN